jgi:hypothetical protein
MRAKACSHKLWISAIKKKYLLLTIAQLGMIILLVKRKLSPVRV